MNLLIFGDSITYGAWDSEGGWVSRLRKRIDQEKFEHLIYNLGISGETTEDLLVRFDHEADPRCDEVTEENVILFAMGTNDDVAQYPENGKFWVEPKRFEENLKTLYLKASKYSKQIAFVSLFPVEESKVSPSPWDPLASYKMENIQTYNEILKKVAGELSVPLIDLFTIFSQEPLDTILHDGLHPNGRGHMIISDEVFSFLRNLKWL